MGRIDNRDCCYCKYKRSSVRKLSDARMATKAHGGLQQHLISSDDSYEVIDPNFDDSYYTQLRGVATADYIPLEEGEVFLRKG